MPEVPRIGDSPGAAREVGPDSRLVTAGKWQHKLWKGTQMVAVERASRYAELSCTICHERFKPGDLVLPSFRNGERRAIHAHVCRRHAVSRPEPHPVAVATAA